MRGGGREKNAVTFYSLFNNNNIWPCFGLVFVLKSSLSRAFKKDLRAKYGKKIQSRGRACELPGTSIAPHPLCVRFLFWKPHPSTPSLVESQVPVELKQPRPADPKNPTKALMMPPPLPPWARFDPRIRSPTGVYNDTPVLRLCY